MDINQLEVLIAVAEERGFSRAAERLFRTQPAVSQAVRRLEEEVGAPLFDRSSKDGTLTDAGRVLLKFAHQMLSLRRDAQEAIKELKGLHRGKVTIGANENTVTYLLPIISAYRARHPHIKIEVRRGMASRIPSEVLAREIEIGIVTFRPSDAALKAVAVGEDEMALVVSPGHPLAGRKTVSVRELGVELFIAHNVRSPYRDRVVQTFEKHRTPLNISIEMPTLEAIKRLVERDVGVALIPKMAAQTEIKAGQLVALQVSEMRLERKLYLIHRSGARLSHAGRAFLNIARQA
ncbi:MAG TPA: LysR family transcriptional regulator [Pyrinomonadaceae bacterium]|nr:LysR family transcriptional regulator [Pyrinomonadaceae bacterium]